MKWALYFLLILLLALAAAQLAWADVVQGKLYDQRGNPVPNRRVNIGGIEVPTDRNGYFTMWLNPGRYQISVPGYRRCQPATITVRPGERQSLNLLVFE